MFTFVIFHPKLSLAIVTVQKVTDADNKPQIPGPSSVEASSHTQRHHRLTLCIPTCHQGLWLHHVTNVNPTRTHTHLHCIIYCCHTPIENLMRLLLHTLHPPHTHTWHHRTPSWNRRTPPHSCSKAALLILTTAQSQVAPSQILL